MSVSLTEIVGQTLDMICVNSTQVYFHFGLEVHICVYDKYIISFMNEDFCGSPPTLVNETSRILDAKVNKATEDGGTVVVEFDNGAYLRLPQSEIYTESYRYVVGGVEKVL